MIYQIKVPATSCVGCENHNIYTNSLQNKLADSSTKTNRGQSAIRFGFPFFILEVEPFLYCFFVDKLYEIILSAFVRLWILGCDATQEGR